MLKHRVIPSLLLSNGGLVKTTKFQAPKYVGDPVNAIRIFNEKEVDELIVLDIDASKSGRGPDFKLIEEFAGECFMPLCYGGGIRDIDDAKHAFKIGVEKVAVQTSALDDLAIVTEIADRFGSQAVVVSIDIRRTLLGRYRMLSSATGKVADEDWRVFRDRAIEAGAGEILVMAVDRDGTLSGMDTRLIELAADECPVPLIAAGGASSLDDLRAAVDAGASVIAAGAMLVFHGPHNAVLTTYPEYAAPEELLDA